MIEKGNDHIHQRGRYRVGYKKIKVKIKEIGVTGGMISRTEQEAAGHAPVENGSIPLS